MFSEQDLSMLRIIECLKCTGMSIKDAVTGCSPTLIRCPYGEYDDHVISAVRSLGMEPIQWDVEQPEMT